MKTKKINFWNLFVIIFIMGVVFSSCSEDEENTSSLEGIWQAFELNMIMHMYDGEVFDFKKEMQKDKEGKQLLNELNQIISSQKYSFDGNIMTFYDDMVVVEPKIHTYTLSGDKIIATDNAGWISVYRYKLRNNRLDLIMDDTTIKMSSSTDKLSKMYSEYRSMMSAYNIDKFEVIISFHKID